VEKWHSWIGGNKIIIKTDNKNILGQTANFDKKVDRWKASLLEFDIEYMHIAGEMNQIADELSIKSQNIKIVEDTSQNHKIFHIENGHPGIKATIQAFLKFREVSPKEKEKIDKHIKTCFECQIAKDGSPIKYGKLKGKIGKAEILKHLSTDVYDPFSAMTLKMRITITNFLSSQSLKEGHV
ncbi:hypothetical protein M153_3450008291, partial [Pseudoloma neurophilia]